MTLLGRPYDQFEFTHDGIGHDVYIRGSGPVVLVLHELPGLAEPTVRLSERIIEAGYTVAMPHLVGGIFAQPANRLLADAQLTAASSANLALCMRTQFAFLRGGKSAPITTWLRALSKKLSDDRGGGNIGVIGMCLTGGYILAMMIDPWVAAPVLSQPAIPLPVLPGMKDEFSVSDDEFDQAMRRSERDGIVLLGFRYSHDWKCPNPRFERITGRMGKERFRSSVFDSPDPAHNVGRSAHSVLTYEFEDADPADTNHPSVVARRRLFEFLAERLPVSANG